MSQRLIISNRINPITGEEVKPLWFNEDGSAFYPVMGAAPDDADDDDDEDDSDDDDDSDSGDSGSEGQEKKSDDGDDALAKITARMKAADKRAADAEKRIKEFEDKDKSELEKATQRVTELEASLSEKDTALKNLQMQNAFLSSNEISWHDSDVALQHADLSGVVDEDGVVDKKALKAALKALADSKPYLVKKDDSGDGAGGSGPSGVPAGSGQRGGSKTKADEEALRKKYPALNL